MLCAAARTADRVAHTGAMGPAPWLPPFVHPPDEVAVPPARPRTSEWVRALVAAAAVAVCIALQYFDPWGPGSGPSALSGHLDLRGVGADVLVMASMWPLLPKVSYRRRDVLFMLVPFYGLWIVG